MFGAHFEHCMADSSTECDRSFTRSDALAKHMRTVHETEALRPSDPVPKNHNPPHPNGTAGSQGTLRRIKITMGGSKTTNGNPDLPTLPTDQPGHVDMDTLPLDLPPWPADLQFTPAELALPPSQLFRLLRRQLHWAQQERDQLRAEMESLDENRRNEWKATQLLVDDILSKEIEVESKADGRHQPFKSAPEGGPGPEPMMRSLSRSRSPMPFDH